MIPFLTDISVESATEGVLTLTVPDGTVGLYINDGDPNTVVTANQGSLCLDNNSTASTVWKKETGTGNTGWVEITGGGGGGGGLYDEVASKSLLGTGQSGLHLRKVLTNRVTYVWHNSAWQIFAMHSTGSGVAFDNINATPGDLEIGQHFTSLVTNITVVWRGAGTGWLDEGPR